MGAACHTSEYLTAFLGGFGLAPAKVGALGLAVPDQAFDCPSCSAALSGAHIFSAAALAQASAQGAGAAAPAPPASSTAGPASASSSSAAHAEALIDSKSSTKIQHMLKLLAEVKQRNESCAAGWGPCPSCLNEHMLCPQTAVAVCEAS